MMLGQRVNDIGDAGTVSGSFAGVLVQCAALDHLDISNNDTYLTISDAH
jgi:hypothetical protein